MIANYHTHTPRCRHAEGTEAEYVQAALDAGGTDNITVVLVENRDEEEA